MKTTATRKQAGINAQRAAEPKKSKSSSAPEAHVADNLAEDSLVLLGKNDAKSKLKGGLGYAAAVGLWLPEFVGRRSKYGLEQLAARIL